MAISQASVTYYADNNFNINNIPASPAVLASASTTGSLEVINCLPLAGKQTAQLTVKTWSKLNTTSYLKLHFEQDGFDWYGIVTCYEYVAMDRVVITITIDAWLTCGGTAGISKVSGITKRHHVLDDTFGKYTQDDGLLSPSKPLRISEGERLFTGLGYISVGANVIVESTIDLVELGKSTYNDSITFDTDGEVTVPVIPSLSAEYSSSTVEMENPDSESVVSYVTTNPALAYFDGADEGVQSGMKKARSLGVENAILAQYNLPSAYADVDKTGYRGYIRLITGKSLKSTLSGDENRYEYANVMNKRLLYGQHNDYTIVSTASGNRLTISPEDLYVENTTHPSVITVVDPRSKGKPSFRFEYVNGDKSNWQNNLIEGLEWQNAPLNFTTASGSEVGRQMYNANVMNRNQTLLENQNLQAFNSAVGVGLGVLESESPIASALTGGISYTQMLAGQYAQAEQYKRSRSIEQAQFLVDNTVVTPQVNFPRSECLRDLVGNGCFVYRTMYSEYDLEKLDVVLNMFGYADVAPLSIDDFKNMLYYNYVEASNVKITTSINVPRHVKELCESQIGAGVRVWKVNPDDSYYTRQNRPS